MQSKSKHVLKSVSISSVLTIITELFLYFSDFFEVQCKLGGSCPSASQEFFHFLPITVGAAFAVFLILYYVVVGMFAAKRLIQRS